MPDEFSNKPEFTYPGVYHIRVSGKVSNELLDYFGGIEKMEVVEQKSGYKETSLIIQIRDQAELIGLINMLYNWRHDLVSVYLEETALNQEHLS